MAQNEDRGAFIWYELMTPDPSVATAFYGAVVGWKIERHGAPSANGAQYHMIVRSDGGMAGGVLGMTQDMIDHGGKPTWLGYVHAPDVDATAKAMVHVFIGFSTSAMDATTDRDVQ